MPYPAQTEARLRAECSEIVSRYPLPRSALLPMLHLVQSEDGHVSPDGIALCADVLGLTTAEVSAVATFYTQYKRHPSGRYNVGVCINTLCAVMGGDAIWDRVSGHLGVGHDETTEDGSVTLERIECNAACDYAPVVMVNWEFFDNETPDSTVELVDRLRAGEAVAPTRGADRVVSFREMSRVLAGFPDGRADEGVGAGPATLAGLTLARRNGWRAPERSQDGGQETVEANVEAGMSPDERGRRSIDSNTDAPAVPQDTGERAGTVAGKPAADREGTTLPSGGAGATGGTTGPDTTRNGTEP